MFKAKIKAEKLKDTVEAISIMVDEIRLKISQNGLSVKAVDPANVAMVSVDVPVDSFDEIEATEGEIGIDLKKLSDKLEMAEKGDVVELEVDENKRKLIVKIRKLVYSLALVSPDSIRKTPTNLPADHECIVTMLSENFVLGVKASVKVSDYVIFGFLDDRFYMKADGDTDSIEYELPIDKLVNVRPANCASLYTLDYLEDMVKAVKKIPEVTLKMKTDYPLLVGIKLDEKRIAVEYMLAPRVEAK